MLVKHYGCCVCVTQVCDSTAADVLQAAKVTFYRLLGVTGPKYTSKKQKKIPQSVYFQG